MTNYCEECGAALTGAVAAILHYQRWHGTVSPCERRRLSLQARKEAEAKWASTPQ